VALFKTIGVIGGMGPEATVDLMQRVIRATPAADDADHVRMVVDNNPRVPSRIRALIEGTGESPVPCLQDMARRLEDYGADILAIPCNTAHMYYDEIASSVRIPLLNMVRLTVGRVLQDIPGLHTAGLLASEAVIKTGLYVDPFAEKGVGLVHPSPQRQADLMTAILSIKAGGPGVRERDALRAAGEGLVKRGAEVLIVACTELSLVAEVLAGVGRHCDAAQVLAEEIVALGTPS